MYVHIIQHRYSIHIYMCIYIYIQIIQIQLQSMCFLRRHGD